MAAQKAKVDIIDAEVLEELHNPDLEFVEPSKKKPRGKRKKDFPRFTDSIRTAVLAAVMKGAPLDTAAEAAGVMPATVYGWLERGGMVVQLLESEDDDLIADIAPVEQDFADFYVQFNKAKSYGKIRLIKIIDEACKDDPKLAMRWLEKLDPVEFGHKEQMHITGQQVVGHVHVRGDKLPAGQDLAKKLPTQDLKALRANIIKDKAKLLEAGEVVDDDDE